MNANTTRRLASARSARGFSLPEVLVAGALLAGVLLVIMGLFVYGGKSVNSGKLMTKATTIASDILEEYRDLSFQQAYLVIEDGGTPATDTSYTWNSATDTPNYPADTNYQAILNGWRTQVQNELPRGTGEVTITVRGIQDLGDGTSEPTLVNFDTARMVQVVVTVRWKEAKRQRSVVFETFKS